MSVRGKIIIITAPSGAGKTTLVQRLLQAHPNVAFSISACTRAPRSGEQDRKDYYFLTIAEFQRLIAADAFVEWEMVYPGKYYGTLKSELARIWEAGKCPLVDIDVMGALAIKDAYPTGALTVFIQAPSIEVLKIRLAARGTETPESLEERISKAAFETTFAPQFHHTIVNDQLDEAAERLVTICNRFLHASN